MKATIVINDKQFVFDAREFELAPWLIPATTMSIMLAARLRMPVLEPWPRGAP